MEAANRGCGPSQGFHDCRPEKFGASLAGRGEGAVADRVKKTSPRRRECNPTAFALNDSDRVGPKADPLPLSANRCR
jgi:hypothetical protein